MYGKIIQKPLIGISADLFDKMLAAKCLFAESEGTQFVERYDDGILPWSIGQIRDFLGSDAMHEVRYAHTFGELRLSDTEALPVTFSSNNPETIVKAMINVYLKAAKSDIEPDKIPSLAEIAKGRLRKDEYIPSYQQTLKMHGGSRQKSDATLG